MQVLHILETVTNTLHLTPQLLSRITHAHNALDQTSLSIFTPHLTLYKRHVMIEKVADC